jgi:hypothetical protein
MKIFQEYLTESVEIMRDSLQYVTKLLEEKEILSRLIRFERDSIGDLTSISLDVSDISPNKRETIIKNLHENGFKNATIEFHDWNKLWLISIERIRIQRKSTANSLVTTFYSSLTNKGEITHNSSEESKEKPSMLQRIMGKNNSKK